MITNADGGLIVYVSPYYPPFGAGGAELTTSLHARILAERGQRVLVVTPNLGAESYEIVDGVEIARHDFQRLAPGEQVSNYQFASPAYQRRLSRAIVEAAAGRLVRCIHAQHQNVVRGAAHAARALDIPLVAHIRDTSQICSLGAVCMIEPDIDHPPAEGCGIMRHAICHQTFFAPAYLAGAGTLGRLARLGPAAAGFLEWRARARSYEQAARIAFASTGLKSLYETLPPFRRVERNQTVYAPVMPAASGEADAALPPGDFRALKDAGHPLVLFVGKVSKGKGCDVLFAAWRRVIEAVPQARLVVAGNIDRAAWDVDDGTTLLLGFVERHVVPSLYAAADIVAMPSTWPEPLGWATLDAARHGKPIVATRVGGIAEAVIDGETGHVVARLDPDAMAQALIGLLREPQRAQAMGRAARIRIGERFGPAAVAAQLDALYAGL